MRIHTKYLLAAVITGLLIGAPIAIGAGENRPVDGGARNPAGGATQSYTKETQIIANTSTYGTRQSNKSDNGGGAVYGCRSKPGGSPAGNEPCLRGTNLVDGLAFEFANNGGPVVGTITSANTNAAPFVTNATGVATGLNADKVDGVDSAQIVTAAQSLNSKGQVSSAGTLANARGITSAARTADGQYTVVFASDITACALNATIVDPAAGANGTVDIQAINATTYAVTTRDIATPATPEDRGFHITAIC